MVSTTKVYVWKKIQEIPLIPDTAVTWGIKWKQLIRMKAAVIIIVQLLLIMVQVLNE